VHNAALAFTISIPPHRDQALMEFGVMVEHAKRWTQCAEHGVGLTWRIMTLLSEGRSHLRHVWFPHAPVASEERYSARFNAPVTFRSDRLALAYASRDLNLPVTESNRELHDLAASYLDRHLPKGRSPFAQEVRQTITALLGTTHCSHREVANALYMHPRSMQRRLHDEGTAFEEFKDNVRRELAERYLSNPEMPLTQVAALVGYSEQSALARSCRRWFHSTPRETRSGLVSRTAI
jgi:AraC-like DNA-binding protein